MSTEFGSRPRIQAAFFFAASFTASMISGVRGAAAEIAREVVADLVLARVGILGS